MHNKVVVTQQQPITVKVKPGGGSGADQYARDIANAAFNKANSAVQKAFTSIEVDGQNTVVALSNTDVLTLIASTGILLETDAVNNSVAIVATGGSAFDETAREIANSAVRTGYTTIDANGTLLITSSNADTLILTGVQANGISITANANTQTIDIALQPTGANAGIYGSANQFITLEVDIYGRILSASNVTPVLDTSVLASGVLEVPRGGTGHNVYTDGQILIGNTVTGNLDKATLQVGTGLSLNIESGNVTVSSNLTLPIQSKSVSYGYPLLGEVITLFYTNTAITFSHLRSVIVGVAPNATIDLIYTDDRSNLNGTIIVGGLVIDNTTFGIQTTSFTDPFVPANNFILLHTLDLSGTVEEISMSLFFHN